MMGSDDPHTGMMPFPAGDSRVMEMLLRMARAGVGTQPQPQPQPSPDRGVDPSTMDSELDPDGAMQMLGVQSGASSRARDMVPMSMPMPPGSGMPPAYNKIKW